MTNFFIVLLRIDQPFRKLPDLLTARVASVIRQRIGTRRNTPPPLPTPLPQIRQPWRRGPDGADGVDALADFGHDELGAALRAADAAVGELARPGLHLHRQRAQHAADGGVVALDHPLELVETPGREGVPQIAGAHRRAAATEALTTLLLAVNERSDLLLGLNKILSDHGDKRNCRNR